MKNETLEPGILQIFRLFVAFRTILFGIGLTYQPLFGFEISLYKTDILVFVTFFNSVGLLFYLLWRWPQKVLGRFYFPLAIIAVSVGTILEFFMQELSMEGTYLGVFFPSFVYLFMPLVLIAWQYGFRTVILYVIGTAALDVVFRLVFPTTELITVRHFGLVFIRTVTFVFVGYMVSKLVKLQREQQAQLAAANRALENANIRLVQHAATIEQLSISQERNRMARELHDVVAHTLSGLAVQLDAVTSLWDSVPPKAEEMLQQALKTTRSGLDETRRAMQNLRASPLEEMGLGLAVQTLAEDTAQRANFTLALDAADHIEGLPVEVEQGFYRVAQEALENITRHAQASRVDVRLHGSAQRLVLHISNDGEGFDPEQSSAYGFGLLGMRERASLMGAQLEIHSRPGEGAAIDLQWEKSS